MKILSYSLALASLASLALGIAFLLFSLPFPALLGLLAFASLGLVAAKINPEI
jgi:predicted PurR-regulated permease PerM